MLPWGCLWCKNAPSDLYTQTSAQTVNKKAHIRTLMHPPLPCIHLTATETTCNYQWASTCPHTHSMYMLVEALCSHVSSRESHLKLFTEAYLQHQHILCPKKKKKSKDALCRWTASSYVPGTLANCCPFFLNLLISCIKIDMNTNVCRNVSLIHCKRRCLSLDSIRGPIHFSLFFFLFQKWKY